MSPWASCHGPAVQTDDGAEAGSKSEMGRNGQASKQWRRRSKSSQFLVLDVDIDEAVHLYHPYKKSQAHHSSPHRHRNIYLCHTPWPTHNTDIKHPPTRLRLSSSSQAATRAATGLHLVLLLHSTIITEASTTTHLLSNTMPHLRSNSSNSSTSAYQSPRHLLLNPRLRLLDSMRLAPSNRFAKRQRAWVPTRSASSKPSHPSTLGR